MRFADRKSRKQIAAFRLLELHAARWRNAKNLDRWNEACRSRWEAEQVGMTTRTHSLPVDFEELPVG